MAPRGFCTTLPVQVQIQVLHWPRERKSTLESEVGEMFIPAGSFYVDYGYLL